MMSIVVNSRKVEQALKSIEKALSAKSLLLTIGNDLVEGVIADQFKQGKDPYGNAWKKLAFRQGQPLRDSGTLSASFMAKEEGDKVIVGTPVSYAPIHQKGMVITAKPNNAGTNSIGKRYGAKALKFKGGSGGFIYAKKVTIPARPILPEEGNLPASYRESIEATINKAINKATRS
jgi:phage gpG-like protein